MYALDEAHTGNTDTVSSYRKYYCYFTWRRNQENIVRLSCDVHLGILLPQLLVGSWHVTVLCLCMTTWRGQFLQAVIYVCLISSDWFHFKIFLKLAHFFPLTHTCMQWFSTWATRLQWHGRFAGRTSRQYLPRAHNGIRMSALRPIRVTQEFEAPRAFIGPKLLK